MKLYHISRDISLERKLFTPRVPAYRILGEDATVKRICASPTIESAFNGFSFKVEYVNDEMKQKNNHYLSVYEFETENYVSPDELVKKVPDAIRTGEHWLLEKIEATPRLVKVNEAKLNRYMKSINEYVGDVVKFHYEGDVVDYDRAQDYFFISQKRLHQAMSEYSNTNVIFEVLEDKPVHYERAYFKNAHENVTSRKYQFIKVKVTIPKGVSAAKLWYLDNLQSEYAIKNKFKIADVTK